MEIREDFAPLDELLQRALALSRQLRRFNLEDWPHLRNRDDFNTIYWLPPSQRNALERVYLDGRDFASRLSSLLSEFNDAGKYPTFRSFVDAVEGYVSNQPSQLERTLAEAEAILPDLQDSAEPLVLMIELAGTQLAMLAPLRDWLRAARKLAPCSPPVRVPDSPSSRRPKDAKPIPGRYAWPMLALLAAAFGAGVLLAVLL